MLGSLRASIIGRGNPFFRYHKGFFKNRADFTESELAKGVEKQVDKNTNKWQGIIPETYYVYTNMSADHVGISNGVSVTKAALMLFGVFGGLFAIERILLKFDLAGDRPFLRKRLPYNNLYLERGGDPALIESLPPIPETTYDPYPYYDKVYNEPVFKK